MLFNSYEFIFGFLPATLIGFYALGRISRTWAIFWLILASLFFYAWWRPVNVLIIAPSILINFLLAQTLLRFSEQEDRARMAKVVLILGIAFNIAFLSYFKYSNFLCGTINDLFGANLVFTHLILPLGISFITFQKIAFLIDVQAGRVKSFNLQDYCTFVLFFPQLIAGPIVHYREMMPQFHAAPCRYNSENMAVGLTLFFLGLFKKLVLADSIAPHVTQIYDEVATGGAPSLLLSWMAAIGFTLQIYFDFSGYSDMALGLARFFGIRLPLNFNSPLRASSIIEFWLRWHVTLTRFLTAYIYNPLTLALTRRRLAKGRSGFGGRNTTLGAFVTLLLMPMLLTMFISGLWHGAGYQFIVWGLLQGVFLSINHAWRHVRPMLWPDTPSYTRFMKPVGWALTFVSVVSAMVFFRSPTLGSALELLKGMVGLNGAMIPVAVYDHLGPVAAWLHAIGVTAEYWSGSAFVTLTAWIAALLVIAVALPNTLQLLAAYEPALGVRARPDNSQGGAALAWKPSMGWALAIALVAATGILALDQLSTFLYWQF